MAKTRITETTSNLSEMRKLIADGSRRARAAIDTLRERIAEAQANLGIATAAPVDRPEIEARIERVVKQYQAIARDGMAFATAGLPTGSYSENSMHVTLDRLKPVELLAIVLPEVLKERLVAEAIQQALSMGQTSMSTAQRDTAINKLKAELRQLLAEEELTLRQLGDLGFVLERRKGIGRDIVDASADQLQAMLS
jgi:hypothetical protein